MEVKELKSSTVPFQSQGFRVGVGCVWKGSFLWGCIFLLYDGLANTREIGGKWGEHTGSRIGGGACSMEIKTLPILSLSLLVSFMYSPKWNATMSTDFLFHSGMRKIILCGAAMLYTRRLSSTRKFIWDFSSAKPTALISTLLVFLQQKDSTSSPHYFICCCGLNVVHGRSRASKGKMFIAIPNLSQNYYYQQQLSTQHRTHNVQD